MTPVTFTGCPESSVGEKRACRAGLHGRLLQERVAADGGGRDRRAPTRPPVICTVDRARGARRLRDGRVGGLRLRDGLAVQHAARDDASSAWAGAWASAAAAAASSLGLRPAARCRRRRRHRRRCRRPTPTGPVGTRVDVADVPVADHDAERLVASGRPWSSACATSLVLATGAMTAMSVTIATVGSLPWPRASARPAAFGASLLRHRDGRDQRQQLKARVRDRVVVPGRCCGLPPRRSTTA